MNMITPEENKRVLAIDPSEVGFGWAVLEGPRNLIDWGLKVTPPRIAKPAQKNNYSLRRIEELNARFDPDALVIEDYQSEGFHRRNRIHKLLQRIMRLSSRQKIKVVAIPKLKVRERFLPFDIHNKSERATRIAGWFPELSPSVPKYRKPWMAEDSRMSIFDAIAMAYVFYSQQKVETSQPSNEKELQAVGN